MVRELNFTRGLEENPYKHLQDFEDICASLMISGMNHETLKGKGFLIFINGMGKIVVQASMSVVVMVVGLF
jgi:hypothetical protein